MPNPDGKKIVGIEYHLTLKKGPINKAIGLKRLLAGIEQLFKGMDWKILGEPKASIAGIDVQLAFKVISKEVVEAAQIFNDAIKRQCEICLFDCELQAIELGSP